MNYLDQLCHIVNSTGEKLEGNCYTYHETTTPAHQLRSKQDNLRLLATKCTHILEIGFNAGHSAMLFLLANPNVKVTTIDIGDHMYVYPCANYMKTLFPDRFEIIYANSIQMSSLSELQKNTYDGLHIDGSKADRMHIFDFLNSLCYLKDECYVIYNDSQNHNVKQFYELCKNSILFHECPEFQDTQMYEHKILKMKRPRIKMVSVAHGEKYRELMKYGLESKYEYCKKHNYPFVDECNSLDSSRPIAWSKIKLIEREMEDYDIIMWIDADTIIMNPAHRLEEFLILMKKDTWFLIGEDISKVPNAGVFFIRNCQESKDFLKDVYQQEYCINHPWWEQKAIIDLVPKYRNNMVIVPHEFIRIFNSYDMVTDPHNYYQHGDFILHLAGNKAPLEKYNQIYIARKNYYENKTWNLLARFFEK